MKYEQVQPSAASSDTNSLHSHTRTESTGAKQPGCCWDTDCFLLNEHRTSLSAAWAEWWSFANEEEKEENADGARVTLRWPWLHLSFSLLLSLLDKHLHTVARLSVRLSSPSRPFLSIQQALIIRGGGGDETEGRKGRQILWVPPFLLCSSIQQHKRKQNSTKEEVVLPLLTPLLLLLPVRLQTHKYQGLQLLLAVSQRHPALCLMTVETQRERVCLLLCLLHTKHQNIHPTSNVGTFLAGPHNLKEG